MLIRSALKRNHLLSQFLNKDQIELCINEMFVKETGPDEVLFDENEFGTHFYIIVDGKFEKIENKYTQKLEPNDIFGELAIICTTKRCYCIKSVSIGKLFVLDCIQFRKHNIDYDKNKYEEIISYIENVPYFNTFNIEKLRHLANLMKEVTFEDGIKLFVAKQKMDDFYVIKNGSVKIYDSQNGCKLHLGAGECFGSLQTTISNSTIVVEKYLTCLTISCREYNKHFTTFEHTLCLLKTSKLHDFHVLETIGTGGYGKVQLVQHKQDKNAIFALKSLLKYDKSQLKHINQEHNIQMCCNSKFIVKLYHSFADNSNIYSVLEYCAGGDLWHLIRQQNKYRFTNSDAKFYAACIIEAFDYLHNLKVVYRDLKPENVVICKNGYAKLTDFGFAKRLNNDKTNSFLGTPEYLAPEMILHQTYGKSVDFWSLGIFIYELLNGYTPFRAKNHQTTYMMILSGIGKVDFPNYMSMKAMNLIKKLCKNLPNERLGCKNGGIDKIRKHEWFSNWNWDKLRMKQIDAPFKLLLSSEIDTYYFKKN